MKTIILTIATLLSTTIIGFSQTNKSIAAGNPAVNGLHITPTIAAKLIRLELIKLDMYSVYDEYDMQEIYNVDSSLVSVTNGALRDEVIQTAKKQLGVPYVWAGNSPDGFDCSGFTSYVMSKNGGELPRRAADQFNDSEKVKAKNVQPGDLVFFNNGSGVSHVGIVISKNGDPLVMIHSSSSKGIIITNVSESEYWTKRLHGFGTYIK